MRSRHMVGLLLLFFALAATALLAAESILYGSPSLPTVLVAAILIGTAAAWPIASRAQPQAVGPGCRECGYASWASTELGFCIHCGSTKVWHVSGRHH